MRRGLVFAKRSRSWCSMASTSVVLPMVHVRDDGDVARRARHGGRGRKVHSSMFGRAGALDSIAFYGIYCLTVYEARRHGSRLKKGSGNCWSSPPGGPGSATATRSPAHRNAALTGRVFPGGFALPAPLRLERGLIQGAGWRRRAEKAAVLPPDPGRQEGAGARRSGMAGLVEAIQRITEERKCLIGRKAVSRAAPGI